MEHALANGDRRSTGYMISNEELRWLLSRAMRLARFYQAKLGSGTRCLSDLFSDAQLGIVDAIRNYDPKRGCDFRFHAMWTMRSRMLNGVRSRDPLSDRVRRIVRAAEREQFTRAVLDGEFQSTEAMEQRVPGFSHARRMAHIWAPLSLDDDPMAFYAPENRLPSSGEDPQVQLLQRASRVAVHAAVARLPQRLRAIIALQSGERFSLTRVATYLGVSPQRTSQLHRQALRFLRAPLREVAAL